MAQQYIVFDCDHDTKQSLIFIGALLPFDDKAAQISLMLRWVLQTCPAPEWSVTLTGRTKDDLSGAVEIPRSDALGTPAEKYELRRFGTLNKGHLSDVKIR